MRMCRHCFRPLHWDADKVRDTPRPETGAWVHDDGNQFHPVEPYSDPFARAVPV